jgi:hypothetical protein
MTALSAAPELVRTAVARLADEAPAPEDVTPGWIYAVVLIGLFVVTILLWLSMRKQLKKIDVDRGAPDSPDSANRPDSPAP